MVASNSYAHRNFEMNTDAQAVKTRWKAAASLSCAAIMLTYAFLILKVEKSCDLNFGTGSPCSLSFRPVPPGDYEVGVGWGVYNAYEAAQ